MSYGLLGEHLSHSYSPMIHSLLGDYEYNLIEKSPEEVSDFIKNGDFKAINVTIPYKKAVIPYLDELSETAKATGSVNVVIRRPDGTLYGDNSDYHGFSSLVKKSKIKIEGKKALILGSGGASATVRAVLSHMGAGEIVTVSRSGENNYENISRHSDASVIVNTTPVGMYPGNGDRIIDLSLFPELTGVLDLIYNPAKTALILDAEARGIPAFGGLHMLVAQAVAANEMFFGHRADPRVTDTIEKNLSNLMKNVVFIGMPGCGKSTIGKRLAAITGREFFDIDREIEKIAGKTIPEIFADEGEEAFRKLETQVTGEICKKSGAVISCGGGIVTRPENRDLIRQNSVVIFISRDINTLATRGRPLSETTEKEMLWEKRSPMYKSWSDVKVLNTGITPTALTIARTLRLPINKNHPPKDKETE